MVLKSFLLLLLLMSSFHLPLSTGCVPDQPDFTVTANSTAHIDYGLSYPVTYKFSIPEAADHMTVFERKAPAESWNQLPTKTSGDFFNGIDAVRFDYLNNLAYVSVGFGPTTDTIQLLFHEDGSAVDGVSFVEINEYYDDRQAACVFTADDWTDGNNNLAFKNACDACYSRQIWFSPAIITCLEGHPLEEATWADIQGKLDQGYVEPVSHSRTHPDVPYDNYDSEVGGSKQDIIDNLELPALNRKGSTEYVLAWTAPYGASNATLRRKLGEYKYLEDTSWFVSTNYGSFPSWNVGNGVYNYWNRYGMAEGKTEAEMNAQWDIDYAAGNIYHLGAHWSPAWEEGGPVYNHLDYIKGKKDVWYVGMGHLFAYHYVQERGQVTIAEEP